jgi:hypothetical protein
MMYFFVRLDPPRPTFTQDMTAEERAVMLRHVAYWTDLMRQGIAHVFGPVLDPAGAYGVGVIGVETEAERDAIIANDPATGLNQVETVPMRAIVPGR